MCGSYQKVFERKAYAKQERHPVPQAVLVGLSQLMNGLIAKSPLGSLTSRHHLWLSHMGSLISPVYDHEQGSWQNVDTMRE